MTPARLTSPRRDARQAGMTILEVLIVIFILGVMMVIAWSTISSTSQTRRRVLGSEERNQELRSAMARVVADLEAAYLSQNEDTNATDRRTLFIGKSGGKVAELRFSSLGHTPLWGDANESEQTQIAYYAAPDRADGSKTNWIRHELRRPSNRPWKDEPAELDVLVRDIEKVTFEFWDWSKQEWRDTWDSTGDDTRNRLPSRARITLTYQQQRGDKKEEVKLVTQAALLMQERVISNH